MFIKTELWIFWPGVESVFLSYMLCVDGHQQFPVWIGRHSIVIVRVDVAAALSRAAILFCEIAWLFLRKLW
jgi:hypothetical protein